MMNATKPRNARILAIAALSAILIAPLFVAAQQPNAPSRRKVFRDSVTELPAQPSRFRGMMVHAARPQHKEEKLELLFALEMPAEARKKLEDAVAAGQIIPPEELARDYSPKQADVDALTTYLKEQGFEVTKVTPDRTGVYARSSAAQIEKSLQVEMVRVFRDGITYTAARNAPSMPPEPAAAVRAIIGLQPFRHAHKHSRIVSTRGGNRRTPNAAAPVAAPSPAIDNAPPYLINEILRAYNADRLAVNGARETIAILIDTVPSDDDLKLFWSRNGIPVDLGRIEKINVSGDSLPPPSGEETLDVEWSSGIAPGARIRVYASGSLQFVDLDKALDAIVADLGKVPGMHQLSISLGLGETFLGGPAGEVATQHQKYLKLAAGGVNVFVSTGDAGSHPDDTGHDSDGPLQAEYAATDTAVVAVGGTILTLDPSSGGVASETGWPGSGGGISMFFDRQPWQKGPGVPAGRKRLVPDLSLAASPDTGALIILQGQVEQIGGTSWSTPTCAGFCALINEARARAGKPPLPYLNTQIYRLNGTPSFRDIRSGSNGPDGQYDCGTGYDLVTGIGVPDVAELIKALTSK